MGYASLINRSPVFFVIFFPCEPAVFFSPELFLYCLLQLCQGAPPQLIEAAHRYEQTLIQRNSKRFEFEGRVSGLYHLLSHGFLRGRILLGSLRSFSCNCHAYLFIPYFQYSR